MSEELKPCPFCGGQAVMGTTYRNGFFTCTIECDKCYIRTQDITSDILELARQDAIEAWNRRVE